MNQYRKWVIWMGTLGVTFFLSSTVVAQPTPALTPRTATGFSTIEQRHVYATPEEGHFEFPLGLGLTAANEISIEEPSMCNGSADARIDYSKADNSVRVRVSYDGLPYKMSAAFQEDRSTPYNQFPQSVVEGKWQLWFVGAINNKESLFYYDGTTGTLIGNEYDVDPMDLPPSAFPISIPVVHMACITMLFESDPDTLKAKVDVTLSYDEILDAAGTGGVLVSYIPMNLCAPDELIPYYTTGGLPIEAALHFDDVLAGIHSGHGFALSTSLEPDPKPNYIYARDNIMIGFTGGYPSVIPEGIRINPLTGEYQTMETCSTREQPRWPAAYYDFCPAQ
ncbi:MAG: hypothetical protein GY822_22235 [Deltaproteobacteria bacterium]|nr:hypothetical protein [Deltaproteobacteria bacterium]